MKFLLTKFAKIFNKLDSDKLELKHTKHRITYL